MLYQITNKGQHCWTHPGRACGGGVRARPKPALQTVPGPAPRSLRDCSCPWDRSEAILSCRCHKHTASESTRSVFHSKKVLSQLRKDTVELQRWAASGEACPVKKYIYTALCCCGIGVFNNETYVDWKAEENKNVLFITLTLYSALRRRKKHTSLPEGFPLPLGSDLLGAQPAGSAGQSGSAQPKTAGFHGFHGGVPAGLGSAHSQQWRAWWGTLYACPSHLPLPAGVPSTSQVNSDTVLRVSLWTCIR